MSVCVCVVTQVGTSHHISQPSLNINFLYLLLGKSLPVLGFPPASKNSFTEGQCMYISNSKGSPKEERANLPKMAYLSNPNTVHSLEVILVIQNCWPLGLETMTDTQGVTMVLWDILFPVVMDTRPHLLVKFLPGINSIRPRITCLHVA